MSEPEIQPLWLPPESSLPRSSPKNSTEDPSIRELPPFLPEPSSTGRKMRGRLDQPRVISKIVQQAEQSPKPLPRPSARTVRVQTPTEPTLPSVDTVSAVYSKEQEKPDKIRLQELQDKVQEYPTMILEARFKLIKLERLITLEQQQGKDAPYWVESEINDIYKVLPDLKEQVGGLSQEERKEQVGALKEFISSHEEELRSAKNKLAEVEKQFPKESQGSNFSTKSVLRAAPILGLKKLF